VVKRADKEERDERAEDGKTRCNPEWACYAQRLAFCREIVDDVWEPGVGEIQGVQRSLGRPTHVYVPMNAPTLPMAAAAP
jgi:hypothetical protein